jgi:regulator of sigma E protease
MIGTIAVVLVFGGLIFFHEMGHFLVARLFGMGVKTFSLGFGPALFSFKRSKTVYQVAAVPLGGYVALVGETADAEIPPPFTAVDSFSLRPAWQRFFVIAAGSVFNLLLAWLICWGVLWINGRHSIPPVVQSINQEARIAASPLEPGDRIIGFNSRSVSRWEQLPLYMMSNHDKDILLTVEKPDHSVLVFTVAPTLLERSLPNGTKGEFWSLGITGGKVEFQTFDFFGAMVEGLREAEYQLVTTWYSLVDLLSRDIAFNNVMGPVGITKTIYKQTEHGVVPVLMLAAFISVNLGIINLLPVPVLDGGHLAFLLVEMVTRRKVPPKVQEKAALVGLFLLLALIVGATFNDVMRLFS